jgi:hypothetical protein
MHSAGETDASSAGAQLARDSRSGCCQDAEAGANHSRLPLESLADSPRCLKQTPGTGAEPQPAWAGQPRDSQRLAKVPESLISEPRLSNSR